jgi:hypothetical protein
MLGVHGVVGSNPTVPTIFSPKSSSEGEAAMRIGVYGPIGFGYCQYISEKE